MRIAPAILIPASLLLMLSACASGIPGPRTEQQKWDALYSSEASGNDATYVQPVFSCFDEATEC